jgi:CheY-like chemotaxis protein
MTLKQHVNRRIVVVDDSRMLLHGMGDYIRDWLEDTEVLLFQDGEAAWQELSQTDPDVLITDMHRFGMMSGWEMLPLLAERNVKYPILLVTGYGEENDPQDGKTLRDVHDLLRGACSTLNVTILPKPFTFETFRKALESCLKISSEI